MDRRVHCFGERVHDRKVVLLGKGVDVYIEVVLGSNYIGIRVVLCMAHMVRKVVGNVDMD